MSRFLIVFAVGIPCLLVAIVAIFGHWVIAAVVLGVGAVAVAPWAVVGGTGGGKRIGVDPGDARPAARRDHAYMVRNKSRCRAAACRGSSPGGDQVGYRGTDALFRREVAASGPPPARRPTPARVRRSAC